MLIKGGVVSKEEQASFDAFFAAIHKPKPRHKKKQASDSTPGLQPQIQENEMRTSEDINVQELSAAIFGRPINDSDDAVSEMIAAYDELPSTKDKQTFKHKVEQAREQLHQEFVEEQRKADARFVANCENKYRIEKLQRNRR